MFEDLPANTLLVLLILMEIIMLIFSLLGQFSSGVYFVFVRIIFLVLAQCCKRPRSAAFYSVLALMNAFYAFDPVGLFITGRINLHYSRWTKKDLGCQCFLHFGLCVSLHDLLYRIFVQVSFVKLKPHR